MTTASKIKTQTMFAQVDQWKASGVTQKTFWAEQDINIHTFSYWVAKRRLTAEVKTAGWIRRAQPQWGGIGNAKQALSLNQMKAKLLGTSETWIAATLFVLNIYVFAARSGVTFWGSSIKHFKIVRGYLERSHYPRSSIYVS